MGLSLRARRRWALAIMLIGLPLWIVAAVSAMNALDARFGRQPLGVELAVHVGLGLVWALPFRAIFRGIGRADPPAPLAPAPPSSALPPSAPPPPPPS